MDFCQSARRVLFILLFSLVLPSSVFAAYNNNEFGLMLGYNYSFHNTSHLHIGTGNTEVDTLHETGGNQDIIWGLSYARNILPWFVAYHDKDLSHSFLQRVWVGVDLLFMDTTQKGNEYESHDPDLDFFDYELEEKTIRLMFNTEIDFNSYWDNVFPFLQASVGAARVAVGFEDEVKPGMGFTGGNIKLSQKFNYNLVYSLGGGFKFLPKPDLQIGVSYLYTDFGVVKSKTESSSVVLFQPIRDHLYTSSVLLNITHLF